MIIEFQVVHNTETVAQRSRQKPSSCGSTNQCKFRKIKTDRSGRSTLSDHNINGEVFHGRIENFFYLSVQTMDFINKQNVSFL